MLLYCRHCEMAADTILTDAALDAEAPGLSSLLADEAYPETFPAYRKARVAAIRALLEDGAGPCKCSEETKAEDAARLARHYREGPPLGVGVRWEMPARLVGPRPELVRALDEAGLGEDLYATIEMLVAARSARSRGCIERIQAARARRSVS
jgi:hypothetical protein